MHGRQRSLVLAILDFPSSKTLPVMLASCLTSVSYAEISEIPPVYGPPYSVPTSYPYEVTGATSVSQALDLWWKGYQDYWNRYNCSYLLTPQGENSQIRAGIKLINGCSGGGYVTATPMCPSGYELSEGRCFSLAGTTQTDKDRGESCNATGNPINVATGNKYQPEVDLSIAGSPLLDVARSYNSHDSRIGDFGVGWQFASLSRLRIFSLQSANVARLELGDGKVLYFDNSSGSWAPDADIRLALTQLADGSGYIVESPDGTRRQYTSNGLLSSIETRDGHQVDYTYTNGNLSSMTDQSGRTVSYSHNNKGLITAVSFGESTQWTYQYDELNRLISVTQPGNGQVQYLYENPDYPFALTGVIDENEVRRGTYSYDDQGRAVSSLGALTSNGTYVEYLSDSATRLTNPLGKETTLRYQVIQGVKRVVQVEGHASANCAAANRNNEYDANGHLIQSTGWEGQITKYERNARGLEIRRTEAAGTEAERVIETEWHPTFRLPLKVTDPQRITLYQYDEGGRLISKTTTPNTQGSQ